MSVHIVESRQHQLAAEIHDTCVLTDEGRDLLITADGSDLAAVDGECTRPRHRSVDGVDASVLEHQIRRFLCGPVVFRAGAQQHQRGDYS